jgi:hypothetical protein
LNIAEDDTDIYFDENKKIANKIVDHTLGKKKLTGEKLKVKGSLISLTAVQ